ncbi:helix-turn-helix domain-containing protein [Clostridioides difficile]|uniref:helix-turn-helix domain-containing protein n=1 Tax=Clostridioides difficile TaxID=1496 RepID=UPI001C684C12|nr:helix-turn-helix transcriptional regulator [Clostridioides difficile]
MENKIMELLDKKGKTRYWLAKEIGIKQQSLNKIASNETVSIRFDILEKICTTLECTPNDVLGWDK